MGKIDAHSLKIKMIHCTELYLVGNIPHCERKELLQATLNIIQDDFPNEAIVDIIEFDAFNRLDPCPVIIKPKWDAPFLIENPCFSEMPIPQCVLDF